MLTVEAIMTIVMNNVLTQMARHKLAIMQSVTMAIGQAQVAIGPQGRPTIAIGRAVVTQGVGHAAEAGVARDLVYGVTIVAGVVYWHGWPARARPGAAQRGRDGGQIEPQLVPEQPVWPVDGGVGLHVVTEVGVKITIVDISEHEDHSPSSRLEDVMESRPHVVPWPLVHNVVVGQHDDGPPAVGGRLADCVGHEGCLGQVGVVETHAVTRLAVLQLAAEDLRHEVLVLDAVADVRVVHLLVLAVTDRTGVTQPPAPAREDPDLKLGPGKRGESLQRVYCTWLLEYEILYS